MTTFTRSQLNELRKQLQSALDGAVDTENIAGNITIEVGNCSYRGGEATFKVKCLVEGAKTREQEDLEYYAELHKLDLTLTMGEDMSLVGYKARARKKPWVLKRLRDGAEFVADTNLVERHFKKRESIHEFIANATIT